MEEEGTWLQREGGEAHEGTTCASGGDHTRFFAVFLWNWSQMLMLTPPQAPRWKCWRGATCEPLLTRHTSTVSALGGLQIVSMYHRCLENLNAPIHKALHAAPASQYAPPLVISTYSFFLSIPPSSVGCIF